MNFKTQSMGKTASIVNAENVEMKYSEKLGKNMIPTHCAFRFWAWQRRMAAGGIMFDDDEITLADVDSDDDDEELHGRHCDCDRCDQPGFMPWE